MFKQWIQVNATFKTGSIVETTRRNIFLFNNKMTKIYIQTSISGVIVRACLICLFAVVVVVVVVGVGVLSAKVLQSGSVEKKSYFFIKIFM